MTAVSRMDCETCRGALSDYLDDALEAAARAGVDEHLPGCDNCRHYHATLRKTIEICRNAPRPCLDGDCLRQAVDAARRELEGRGLI